MSDQKLAINLPNIGVYLEMTLDEISESLEYCIAGDLQEAPSNLLKILSIKCQMEKFNISLMIETGTYMGLTTGAISSLGKRVITIELSEELHNRAKQSFADRPLVQCLQGDSTVVLPEVLESLSEPALFWLDGHFSGGVTARGSSDTPIIQEIDSLIAFRARQPELIDRSVIFIDDAREFGRGDYPTMDSLIELLRRNFPNHHPDLHNCCVRVLPRKV